MLQTNKISKDTVAVAWDATAISLRKSGRKYFGTEEDVVSIKDGKLIISKNVAREFGIAIVML